MSQIQRAIPKKVLRNHEDVAEVVVSEIIHDLEDQARAINEEINEKELEIKSITQEAIDEIPSFLNEKYKDLKESFNEKILKPLGISGEAAVDLEMNPYHEDIFNSDGVKACIKLKGHIPGTMLHDEITPPSYRLEIREMHSPYIVPKREKARTSQSQMKLSFVIPYSEMSSLKTFTKCVELRAQMNSLYEKYRLLQIEIQKTNSSKSRISTSFKRKTLEQNETTKQMLEEAKKIAIRNLSSTKLIEGK